jgi:hypothetical protein
MCRVRETLLIEEPAGIFPAISKATSARRMPPVLVRPENMDSPAPLLTEPIASSYKVLSLLGDREMVASSAFGYEGGFTLGNMPVNETIEATRSE